MHTLTQSESLKVGERLQYGVTYKGQDFICGSMPRDLGAFVTGIEIAINNL